MKINIFKSTVIFFFAAVILLILIVLYDFANYDSSYINRNSLTFSINNLNSKKTKKLFKYYENLYGQIAYKISKNHKKYWRPEDTVSRIDLPKIKVISKKKDNFSPGRKIEEVEKNFSNWPRSHGGFSSMRFSSLDLINKNNVDKLMIVAHRDDETIFGGNELLSEKGWKVIAVEPANELRNLAQANSHNSVTWCNASLPALTTLPQAPKTYDLILLSAVWMHLPKYERPPTLKRLAELLSENGTLYISLRFGPNDEARPMHPVSYEELATLAKSIGLTARNLNPVPSQDGLKRDDVKWVTVEVVKG